MSIDVDAFADELVATVDRKLTEREQGRRDDPAGCRFCGTIRSSSRFDGQWWPEARVCGACQGDRLGTTDQQHRWKAVKRLLGDGLRGWLPEYALPRLKFAWFSETPGAQPGKQRFGYVSVPDLRANLVPPPPAPPEYHASEPCPRCGCADRWTTNTVDRVQRISEPAAVGGDTRVFPSLPREPGGQFRTIATPTTAEVTSCACGYEQGRRVNPDVSGRVARLCGLRFNDDAATVVEALKLRTWQDHKASDASAVPPSHPWGFWWSTTLIRARAYALMGATADNPATRRKAARRFINRAAFETCQAAHAHMSGEATHL